MTSPSDGVAEWRRKSRFRDHREHSKVRGWRRFLAEASLWSAVTGAVLAIWAMMDVVRDPGVLGEVVTLEGPVGPAVDWRLLVALVLAFGLFVACCCTLARAAARVRRPEGDGR